MDILGYLKNTHKNPNQGTWLGIPWLGLVSLCQIWDFYGYSLKYPKISKNGNPLFFPVSLTYFFFRREVILGVGWGGGGLGEVLGSIFAGYVPLASQSTYPKAIIVYSGACNFRSRLSQFWANVIFAIPSYIMVIFYLCIFLNIIL